MQVKQKYPSCTRNSLKNKKQGGGGPKQNENYEKG